MRLADIFYGVPHEPSASCHDDHCAIHNRDEQIALRWIPGAILCWECGHYYRSGVHLRIANFRSFRYWGAMDGPRLRWTWWKARSLFRRHIYSCPHCAHDF